MIGDDAESDIDLDLFWGAHAAGVLVAAARGDFLDRRAADRHTRVGCAPLHIRQRAGVFFAAQFFDLIEDRAENVGLVIRSRSGKIGEILGALNDCYGALETHSGIDVRAVAAKTSIWRVTASGYRFALNWMKTKFQISMQRGSFLFTSAPRVSPSGVRSMCTSEHGPHGPVSPIIQKLSAFPLLRT